MITKTQEIEYDLIGIALGKSNNETLEKILSLNIDDFTTTEHKEIFKAIKNLHRESEPLDMFKVTDKLKESCKPKLLDSCLNVLGKISTNKEKDRFEFQSSNIDMFVEQLASQGMLNRNPVIAHPSYEANDEFLSLGFRETIIEDDKPKDRNFYVISHDDIFSISDSDIFQHKNQKIIFDVRGRLLCRHQDKWNKDRIRKFVDNPITSEGIVRCID
ncbi:MAG: hypothetical protein B6D35_15020, partial [Candidatus Brocadia sp. UTAMX2]